MNLFKKTDIKNSYLCRCKYKVDLLEQIIEFCNDMNIKNGIISGIGAVMNLTIGFYDQKKHEYLKKYYEKPFEILNITGNISLKNNEIFPHIHVVVADENNKAFGGHLASPSKVFACEINIIEFDELSVLERKPDGITGLSLWQ